MAQSQALTLVDVFQYQGNPFRYVLIDNEPWWPAVDICTILGIGNVSKAVDKLNENECITLTLGEGNRGNPNKNYVNEPGLYRLIFRSDKPEAKVFQDWVYREVLPSIRKTGNYSLQGVQDFNIGEMLMLESQDEFNQRMRRLRVVRRAFLPQQPTLPKAPKEPKPVRTVEETILDILTCKYQGQMVNTYDISQAGNTLLRTFGSVATRRICETLVTKGILDKEGQGKTTLYGITQ